MAVSSLCQERCIHLDGRCLYSSQARGDGQMLRVGSSVVDADFGIAHSQGHTKNLKGGLGGGFLLLLSTGVQKLLRSKVFWLYTCFLEKYF